jgi:hypothetical protein
MLELQIHGMKWKLQVLESDKFRKKFEDCEGITIPETRRIYFLEDELDIEVVEHELVHAYMDGLCLDSTREVSKDDLEEIFCELFAKYSTLIKRQAKWALKELRS